MKRKLITSCLAVAVILSCLSGCTPSISPNLRDLNDTSNPIDSLSIKRGINLSLLERENLSIFGSFITKEKTYLDIKEQGFDHIRLPVNFHLYYKNGKLNGSFMKKLDSIINTALNCGLTVVLDFHGWYDINSDVNSNKREFYEIWTLVSEHYKDYSYNLLFEILNEPYEEEGPDPLNAYKLNEIQLEAIKIIRETNPKRIIVAASPEWNTWWGLKDLILPEDDPNIIVDIHTYQPMEFTHQGALWYSPDATVQVRLDDSVFTEINKVIKTCKEYMGKTGRLLWLGEFGMELTLADEGDVSKYLGYVASESEKIGMPWAYWEYNRSFGAYDPSEKEWRPYVLDALMGE